MKAKSKNKDREEQKDDRKIKMKDWGLNCCGFKVTLR